MESKIETVKVIMTHNGMFHCDEALAMYMLINHTKEFKNAKITRTRKKEDWLTADALVDVGGEFNVEKRRFDHHQKNFKETFSSSHSIKLSSAGLVYKIFGKEIIEDILSSLCRENEQKIEWTTQDIEDLYNYIYLELIESIDGVDNGASQYELEIAPKYRISTDLSCRVSRMNSSWNEAKNGNSRDDLEMQRFEKAMRMCGEELIDFIRIGAFSFLPARRVVQTALSNRHIVHHSLHIIELPSFCPWTDHLFALEKTVSVDSQTDLPNQQNPVLFAIIATDNNEYIVRATPLYPKSTKLRKQLKPDWCGVPDNEIESVSGIRGLKFVHPSGFLGGAKTRQAALDLAIQSLS